MTERRYAEGTSVSVGKTQGDIQDLLIKKGADGFGSAITREAAGIEFAIGGRRYRMAVPLPSIDDPEFWKKPNYGSRRSTGDTQKRFDAEVRRRWRALFLVVKSKLTASESGISTFEEEFALYTVLPNGRTAAEVVLPSIEQAYETGEIPDALRLMTGTPALTTGDSNG